jgi:hypothetical protein
MIGNDFLLQELIKLSQAGHRAGAELSAVRQSPVNPRDGIVLCNIKDEFENLPHFLRHYRKIGVTRFVFVDNGSTDRGSQYLADQNDCDVFQCLGSFRNSRAGMNWKNALLMKYAAAKWYFSADADEHVVYEGWPDVSLDEFASRLELRGQSAATALMVDMYGREPVARAPSAAMPDELLLAYPYFDGEGYSISSPSNWRLDDFPRQDARGGPVQRILGGEGKGWLAKTPLILQSGIFYFDPHTVLPVALNFSPMTMALLHFRLTRSLAGRIGRLAELGYSQGNTDVYRALGRRLQEDGDFSFWYPGSAKFQSPRQFVDRSMIAASGMDN